MQALADALLGTDPQRRTRLEQAGLGMLLMALSVGVVLYAAQVGHAPPRAVWWWAAVSMFGLLTAFVAIRSGWSLRFEDPSLTLPQMLFAITSGAAGYALAGPVRGATFPVLMVILMFGMFQLRPRMVSLVSAYALLLFGVVMVALARREPQVYRPDVELGHFLMLVAMLPAVSVLAARLTRLRERNRRHRRELAQALARIQELATRDELTGLINRRHMQDLLEQEHQRCVRSGHAFSVAMIDIDHFKQINDDNGHAAGDEVLRHFAREALAAVRVADVLSRWGGEEFVLLLADTHLSMARVGVERLRQHIAAGACYAGPQAPIKLTVSIGLAEHIAGQSVAEALARADAALYEAKAQGRNRTVLG